MNSHSARPTTRDDAETRYREACWHYLDRLFRDCPNRRELRELANLIETLRPRVQS